MNMFKRFKNIKLSTLIVNVLVSITYPIIKVCISEYNRLLIFTDTTTIIAFVMIILGILFRLYQKGDFDRTAYIANRSIYKNTKKEDSFLADAEKEREESFNYPLFIGICYLIICIIISRTLL